MLSISEINFISFAFMTSLVLKVFTVHTVVSQYNVFSYLSSLFVRDAVLWNVSHIFYS
jgi:hypothetical protein